MVITDGRGEMLQQTLATAMEHIEGFSDLPIVGVNDSGDLEYADWLDGLSRQIAWRHHPSRRGLAAAIRTAWDTLDEADYVLHLEDDLRFTRLLWLENWITPLEADPYLAQVCLQRGPQEPVEIEAGGILPLYAKTHTVVERDGWVEQDKLFSLQPNICPWWVTRVGWPEHGGETEFTAKLREHDPDVRFAYLGGMHEEPHYEHVGHGHRQPGWRV